MTVVFCDINGSIGDKCFARYILACISSCLLIKHGISLAKFDIINFAKSGIVYGSTNIMLKIVGSPYLSTRGVNKQISNFGQNSGTPILNLPP